MSVRAKWFFNHDEFVLMGQVVTVLDEEIRMES